MEEEAARHDDDRAGRIARRVLLGNLGVATAGALAVAGLGLTGHGVIATAPPSATPGHDHTAATTVTASPRPSGPPAAPLADHDAAHKAVTAAFPAKTQGQGLQELGSR